MDSDYPGHLLAREPAPPYAGEPPFTLWHFSEDPALGRFEPRPTPTYPETSLVWAVDTRHAPMFWFPRDCPRGCVWPVSTTTPEDQERFFGQSAARRVHVMEASWLDRMRDAALYAYRMPPEAFRPHESVGGYWVADQPVEATERAPVPDLIGRHAQAADNAVDLAILGPGHQLDAGVQRHAAPQRPGPALIPDVGASAHLGGHGLDGVFRVAQ